MAPISYLGEFPFRRRKEAKNRTLQARREYNRTAREQSIDPGSVRQIWRPNGPTFADYTQSWSVQRIKHWNSMKVSTMRFSMSRNESRCSLTWSHGSPLVSDRLISNSHWHCFCTSVFRVCWRFRLVLQSWVIHIVSWWTNNKLCGGNIWVQRRGIIRYSIDFNLKESRLVSVTRLKSRKESYDWTRTWLSASCLKKPRQENLFVTEEEIQCGEHVLGMKAFPPIMHSGQLGPRYSMFKTPAANRRIYDYTPILSPDSVKYVTFSPVDELSADPDILIITANVTQAEILLRASSYSNGKMWLSKSSPTKMVSISSRDCGPGKATTY